MLPALSQGVWTQRAAFPGFGRNEATAFSDGTFIYFGGGTEILGPKHNDLWRYDPAGNSWTPLDSMPAMRRFCAFSFSIGSRGYVGAGFGSSPLQDLWEYNTVSGVWTQKANFAGGFRYNAVAFSIGNKGYAGTGYSPSGYAQDFYEYDPVLNTWTPKANFGGGMRQQAVAFSLGGYGYVGTGTNGVCQTDFWKYDPVTDSWTSVSPFPGQSRMTSSAFVIGNMAYVGTGWTPTQGAIDDVYSYDPLLNSWSPVANFPTNREGATGIHNGSRGYIGNGNTQLGPNYQTDWWEFIPDSMLTSTIAASNVSTISLYPNPAREYVTLKTSGVIKHTTELRIVDVRGRKMTAFSFDPIDKTISVSAMAPGLYFVYIEENGRQRYIDKLIILPD